MASDKSGEYLLAVGEAEMQRLRLQAHVWEPVAEAFLDAIGVAEGWRTLDLGCGAMGILGPLSHRVGSKGRVVGLDRDATQLAAARAYVRESGLTNVGILEGDAFNTGLPAGGFDLVHARFLFAPVGHDDALLAEMLRLARPGGIIALEEPDASCWNVAPSSEAWTALKTVILSAFRAAGGDFNAGCRTFGMLRTAGLRQVAQRNAVLAITGQHPYKRLPLQFADSLRKKILDSGLMSVERLAAVMSDCAAVAEDPNAVMTSFIVTQVSGQKPD